MAYQVDYGLGTALQIGFIERAKAVDLERRLAGASSPDEHGLMFVTDKLKSLKSFVMGQLKGQSLYLSAHVFRKNSTAADMFVALYGSVLRSYDRDIRSYGMGRLLLFGEPRTTGEILMNHPDILPKNEDTSPKYRYAPNASAWLVMNEPEIASEQTVRGHHEVFLRFVTLDPTPEQFLLLADAMLQPDTRALMAYVDSDKLA